MKLDCYAGQNSPPEAQYHIYNLGYKLEFLVDFLQIINMSQNKVFCIELGTEKSFVDFPLLSPPSQIKISYNISQKTLETQNATAFCSLRMAPLSPGFADVSLAKYQCHSLQIVQLQLPQSALILRCQILLVMMVSLLMYQ